MPKSINAVMKATLREIKEITYAERRRCVKVLHQEAGFARLEGRTDAAIALRAAAVRLEHPEREDQ